MKIVSIQGVEDVRRNMKRAIASQAAAFERGLKRAGLFIQNESTDIVPVQLGVLKASAYTRAKGKGFKTTVFVGYTAAYAIYVHENPFATHGEVYNMKHKERLAHARVTTVKSGNFQRGENQQYKFLEVPVKRKQAEILEIIKDSL